MSHEIDPIYVSATDAARILGVSRWLLYKRLDEQAIESRYEGRKRLVVLASLREYAASLPTTAPRAEAS